MRKIIFFSIFSVLMLATQAQTSITVEGTSSIAPEHIIIREYKYPSSIISAFDTNGKYSIFAYLDSNMVSRAIGFDFCTINDFEISNDSVFFCGTTKESKGMIGFFDIHDVFWGTEQFCYNDNFIVDDGCNISTSFNKLSTYRDEIQARHIVCTGESKTIVSQRAKECTVDLKSDSTGAFTSYDSRLIRTDKSPMPSISGVTNIIRKKMAPINRELNIICSQ